ncbi:hypothetical protein FACS189421_11880 [Bacteroidia bacterium]|nr:hypothetical protein FACS189421_11880 [Bacteroidia bacterium]
MPAAYVDGDGLSPDSIRASVADLESQIAAVDAELSDCRHAVSDWKTATIIGGVGVGVTGIGAAVQLNKLNKAKKSGKVETTTEKKKE